MAPLRKAPRAQLSAGNEEFAKLVEAEVSSSKVMGIMQSSEQDPCGPRIPIFPTLENQNIQRLEDSQLFGGLYLKPR
ncbi:MAG: hypothetical protein MK130_07745 [Puniceicoccaceae bacterium]|nr:hypothetical protein [Puniceicoccaceae bacterium]